MLQLIYDLIRPYKKIILITLLLQIGQTVLALMLPELNANIIDVGVANQDVGYITTRGIIMVVLSILQFALAIGACIEGARLALTVGLKLRNRLYEKILTFSSKEISHFGAPTLITRATGDAQNLILFVTTFMTNVISAPIMFIGGIVFALLQNFRLSTIIWISLPVIIGVAVGYVLSILPSVRKKQKITDRINGILRDQISGVRVVKAFNREKFETEKLNRTNNELLDLNIRINRAAAFISPAFILIVNLSNLGLLWNGGVLAENGQAGIGQIITFITYLSYILTAVLSATMLFIIWPQAEISADRILEVLNTPSSIADSENPQPAKKQGTVSFEDVSFSFSPEKEDVENVLDHVSFEAVPGEFTAIIGSTGSGKSTILNLISRLADATGGSVKIDGTDLRDLSLIDLNEMIGVIPQKSFLFKGTLADNLRHGNPEATDEELWEALRIAQAEDFIKGKENGLYTEVSEGGTNFSGGQRQRLAIARAIVKNPRIYLFDDSFSALDYATDKKLRDALKEKVADKTFIVVAQRISTIKNADKILVLNNGRIEASGTHDELMKISPTYQDIVASQPAQDADEGEEAAHE